MVTIRLQSPLTGGPQRPASDPAVGQRRTNRWQCEDLTSWQPGLRFFQQSVVKTIVRQTFALLAATLIVGTYSASAQKRNTVEMPNQIVHALVREDESVKSCIESSGGVSQTFRAESIDLSKAESTDEIVVRGISPCVCGPRRCINRIYRKEASVYSPLFKADYAQEIELRREDYTNGYRNLYPAVYMFSAFTSVLYAYQYDGHEYKWDHCEMRFYVYGKWNRGKQGPVRYHQSPEISWVGCNPVNPFS